MKEIILMISLLLLCGCAAAHSPYDLYAWCRDMGSSRLSSIGPKAQAPATCDKELKEDLADRTPRILYVPRDIAMAPVIGARAVWVFVGMTQPPF